MPKSALENDNLCLVEMVPREEGPERDEVATAAAVKLGGTVAAGMAPKDADGSPRACNSPEESEAAQVLKKISFQVLLSVLYIEVICVVGVLSPSFLVCMFTANDFMSCLYFFYILHDFNLLDY